MGFNISLANIGAVKSRMLDAHVDEVKGPLLNACDHEKALYALIYQSHVEKTQQFNSVASSVEKVGNKLLAIADSDKPKPRYKVGLDAKLLINLDWLIPAR